MFQRCIRCIALRICSIRCILDEKEHSEEDCVKERMGVRDRDEDRMWVDINAHAGLVLDQLKNPHYCLFSSFLYS